MYIYFHQISHRSFCQKGITNIFKWFDPIEKDGYHAHVWIKTLKNLLQESFGAESWYKALRAQGLPSLFKW